jgi:uncharacterized membrane protein HdeD (DUF308 family)
MGVADRIGAALKRHAPWRPGISWMLVLIEGAIVFAIGLIFVFKPGAALSTVRGLTGAFLLFNSLLGLWSGLRGPYADAPEARFRLARAGIALIVGVIVVLQPVFEYIDANAARTILGVGLLLWGALGLLSAFAGTRVSGRSWGAVIVNVLAIAFAIMIFATDLDDHPLVRPVGIIALVAGCILLAYGYLLRRDADRDENAATALPV